MNHASLGSLQPVRVWYVARSSFEPFSDRKRSEIVRRSLNDARHLE